MATGPSRQAGFVWAEAFEPIDGFC